MLILNDDLNITLLFRGELGKSLSYKSRLFIINRSWSHFVISKDIVKKVGWFEERLPGTGQEDGDYRARMENLGFEVIQANCHGVINYVAAKKCRLAEYFQRFKNGRKVFGSQRRVF